MPHFAEPWKTKTSPPASQYMEAQANLEMIYVIYVSNCSPQQRQQGDTSSLKFMDVCPMQQLSSVGPIKLRMSMADVKYVDVLLPPNIRLVVIVL